MNPLTETTEDFLVDLINDYMSRGQAFTSLDIANQAKEAGHRARNHQVAEWLRRNVIVQAHASGYLFNQTLITVDSKAVGITLAYLYHYYLEDSDEYLDRDQNPKSFIDVSQPVAVPKFSGSALLAGSGPLYFDTRESARDFARARTEFKFQDFGQYACPGERWACVSS